MFCFYFKLLANRTNARSLKADLYSFCQPTLMKRLICCHQPGPICLSKWTFFYIFGGRNSTKFRITQAAPTLITNNSYFPREDQVKVISSLTGVISQRSSWGCDSLQPPSEEDNVSTSPDLLVCNLANTDGPLPTRAAWQTQQRRYVSLHLGAEQFSQLHPQTPAAASNPRGSRLLFSSYHWENHLLTCSWLDFISL